MRRQKAEHFFIIGAQRSGTTFLYRALNAHPQIMMAQPERPEPKVFINEALYSKGKHWYETSFFPDKDTSPEVLQFGEKSTSYIEFPDIVDILKEWYPGFKLVVSLRNPVTRALSNYRFSCSNGLESRSLQEVFLDEKKIPEVFPKTSVSPFNYLGRGCYAEMLAPFMERCPERIHVLLYEQMVSDTIHLQNVYRFLGVNPDFVPEGFTEKINSTENDEDCPAEVLEFLRKYYRKRNAELASLLGMKSEELWNE